MNDPSLQLTPDSRLPRRALLWVLLLLGLAAALALDNTGYRLVTIHDRARLASIEGEAWYRLLRLVGWWPTWLAISAAILIADRARRFPNFPRRAVFLALCTAASGLGAELVKGVVGRMRPKDTDGALQFLGLHDRLSHWSDLSMPSSHAAVAFAAAFAIARIRPGIGALVLALAALCGLTRILAGAHFVSDVYAAALIAAAATGALWRLDARNNGGVGLRPPP